MPETVTVAAEAMATRFEVALHGAPEAILRAAAEEALAEITRLEGMLSLYQPTSEIAHINTRGDREPVRVSPEVFSLLEHCVALGEQTGGCFDITLAPLMRCWRFMNDSGAAPSDAALAAARALCGWPQLRLDPEHTTVQLATNGALLDLGSVGKGYALEQAATLLQENEFENFFIHGGTSTVCARGEPRVLLSGQKTEGSSTWWRSRRKKRSSVWVHRIALVFGSSTLAGSLTTAAPQRCGSLRPKGRTRSEI